ncbi:hypothetical protein, partial [Yersinia pestis]
ELQEGGQGICNMKYDGYTWLIISFVTFISNSIFRWLSAKKGQVFNILFLAIKIICLPVESIVKISIFPLWVLVFPFFIFCVNTHIPTIIRVAGRRQRLLTG